MNNTKQIPMLAALLAVAMGAVIFSWRQTHAPPPAVASNAGVHAGEVETLLGEVDRLAASVQTQVEARAERLDVRDWPARVVVPVVPADPVADPVAETPEQKVLRLKGIARVGEQAVAFVNDSTLSVGETLDGYEVAEIGPEHVVLKDGAGETITLRLYEPR